MGGLDPTLGYLRTRARARRLGGDGQQAAALAPRARAARRRPRRPAPSCASRPRRAPRSRSSRCCASRCWRPRSPRSPASSTAPPTSSSPRWRAAGSPTPRRSARAQELGYAEADPTEDVDGADAAAKMAILSSIAFHSRVLIDDVPYEGIDRAAGRGPRARPLAGLRGQAARRGAAAERLGERARVPGAGAARPPPGGDRAAPTTRCCSSRARPARSCSSAPARAATRPPRRWWPTSSRSSAPTRARSCTTPSPTPAAPIAPPGAVPSAFYVRMSVADRPGVLARVASIFGDAGALDPHRACRAASGDEASLVLVLHAGPEARMAAGAGGASAALADVLRRAGDAAGARLGRGRATAPMTALIERYRDFLPVGPATPDRVAGRGRHPAGAAAAAVGAPRRRGPRQARGHEPDGAASRTAA